MHPAAMRTRGLLLSVVLASCAVNAAHAATDLIEAYQLAAENDAEFQAAGAANRAAQEATPQARAELLPSLSASGSVAGTELDVREASSVSAVGRRNFPRATA